MIANQNKKHNKHFVHREFLNLFHAGRERQGKDFSIVRRKIRQPSPWLKLRTGRQARARPRTKAGLVRDKLREIVAGPPRPSVPPERLPAEASAQAGSGGGQFRSK